MSGLKQFRPCILVIMLAVLQFVASTQGGIIINPIGSLYVDPPNYITQPVGTNITYTLSIASMEVFKSWDISVMVDPSVLRPLETAHNFGGLESSRCIGGEGIGCTSSDGLGVVHLAVQLTYIPPVEHLWGPLFTIRFKVVGDPGTAIVITSSTLISATRGTPLEHSTSHGKYAQPPEVLNAFPSYVLVGKRGSNHTTVALTGFGDFTGTILLNATVSSNTVFPAFRPRLELNPATLSVAVGQTSRAVLTINGTSLTAPGTYTVNIIGISSLMPAFTSITILVPQVYVVHEFRYPQSVRVGESAHGTSTLKNLGELSVRIVSVLLRGEFGTLALFSAQRGGITICGGDYSGAVYLSSGDEKTVSWAFTIPNSTRNGNHTMTAEAYWQYPDVVDIYGNPVSLWCDGQPILIEASIQVLERNEPNPPQTSPPQARFDLVQLANWMRAGLVPAIGVYLGLLVLAVVLVFRERRRKRQAANGWEVDFRGPS